MVTEPARRKARLRCFVIHLLPAERRPVAVSQKRIPAWPGELSWPQVPVTDLARAEQDFRAHLPGSSSTRGAPSRQALLHWEQPPSLDETTSSTAVPKKELLRGQTFQYSETSWVSAIPEP